MRRRKPIREYMRRIGASRGFGIQSPWAFSFVTEVIGERLPYYAYAAMEQQYVRGELKWQKLFFRVRNYCYPHAVEVLDIADADEARLQTAIEHCGEHGCIILRGINDDDRQSMRFAAFRDREEVGITFDLYYCAICFLDRSIYKQHYRLNF